MNVSTILVLHYVAYHALICIVLCLSFHGRDIYKRDKTQLERASRTNLHGASHYLAIVVELDSTATTVEGHIFEELCSCTRATLCIEMLLEGCLWMSLFPIIKNLLVRMLHGVVKRMRAGLHYVQELSLLLSLATIGV